VRLVEDLEPVALRRIQDYLESRRSGAEVNGACADAWETFYRSHTPLIRGLARKYRWRGQDLEDCVQEVWRVVIVRLPRFRFDPGRAPFRSWLEVVVRHSLVDQARRARPEHVGVPNLLLDRTPDGRDPDPAACYERARVSEMVWEVLGELRAHSSESSFQVFYMRSIEGRSAAEIAAILGLKPEQVWYRQHRMMRKLKEIITRSPRRCVVLADSGG